MITEYKSTLDITPETVFIYPIKLPESIKAGSYTLELTAKHSQENDWKFNKTIKISKQEVKRIKKISTKKETNRGVYILILSILVIVVSINCLILLRKNRQKNNH